jgi:hypothetical protein
MKYEGAVAGFQAIGLNDEARDRRQMTRCWD